MYFPQHGIAILVTVDAVRERFTFHICHTLLSNSNNQYQSEKFPLKHAFPTLKR